MQISSIPKSSKSTGPSVGSRIVGFLEWFLFIPFSVGFYFAFPFIYDRVLPPQKLPELVEVKPIEIEAPVVKEQKPVELSPEERAKIAEEKGYLHVALNLIQGLVSGATFQKRFEYIEKADMIEQRIADQRNYKAAAKLFESKNYYAARICLDDIFDPGNFAKEIEELNKQVDLALSVDDAMVVYIEGKLEEVVKLLALNESEEAQKLMRKASEILDLVATAKLKLEQMNFEAAKSAYEEIMSTIDEESHPTYQDAKINLEALSDKSKLAQMLIQKGDKLLNERKFSEVKQYYIRAAEYDVESGKKKIEYFDELPKLLFKRASENQSTRPMMAYYALKDAYEMVEEGSLKSQIKNKMVAIGGVLKRYDVKVE